MRGGGGGNEIEERWRVMKRGGEWRGGKRGGMRGGKAETKEKVFRDNVGRVARVQEEEIL